MLDLFLAVLLWQHVLVWSCTPDGCRPMVMPGGDVQAWSLHAVQAWTQEECLAFATEETRRLRDIDHRRRVARHPKDAPDTFMETEITYHCVPRMHVPWGE